MSAVISYDFYSARRGAANGFASLDSGGKVPVAQLPNEAIETYKGQYATQVALTTACPAGVLADYAYVTATNSYWYWNSGLTTPAWVNQQIAETAYNALTTAAQQAVPYVVMP